MNVLADGGWRLAAWSEIGVRPASHALGFCWRRREGARHGGYRPIRTPAPDAAGCGPDRREYRQFGRGDRRRVSRPTADVPTGNTANELSDGACINLTQALDCDRTGQTYDAPIPPDQAVPMEWSLLDSARDPVVTAASDWLRSQPGFSA